MIATPNKRALRVVREQRGLTLSLVSDYTKISATRLEEFERGERNPSRKQVEKLADAYGVPLYWLFNRDIPEVPALPQDFRKAQPTPAALSPRGIKTIVACERISKFTFQLANELRFRSVDHIAQTRTANSTKRKANSLRDAFDAWFSPRQERLVLSGSIENKFLNALRLFYEIQGGVVNVNDAPSDDYMGFYIKPVAGLSTIFINRSISSKKAQLFTFAHEYCHALLGEDGISNPFASRNAVERTCNIFAAEFLAPMETFSRLVEAFPKTVRRDTKGFIELASARTLLSKHAAGIRLLEGDYITQAEFHAWRRVFVAAPRREKEEEQEEAGNSAGGVPHAKRISELGYLPVALAKRAMDAKYIDALDIVQCIGLSLKVQERAFSLANRRLEAALN